MNISRTKFSLFFFLFVGCDGLSTSSNGSGGNGNGNGGTSTVFEGTWIDECDASNYTEFRIDFVGSSYTQTLDVYLASCSASLVNSITISTQFDVGLESQIMSIPSYEVNLGLSSTLSVTVNVGSAVYNSANFCNKNDWTDGVEAVVDASQCSDWLTYNTFGIDSLDTLYIGDPASGDGTSEMNRPTSLSTDFVLIKSS